MPLAERLNSNAIINLRSLVLYLTAEFLRMETGESFQDLQDLPEVGQAWVILQSLRKRICTLVSDGVAPHSATNSFNVTKPLP